MIPTPQSRQWAVVLTDIAESATPVFSRFRTRTAH